MGSILNVILPTHFGDSMIYDKLPVALLSALASERRDTTNAIIARYLITHASKLEDASIKAIARACNVGTASVSRFCRDVGFESFDELRKALAETQRSFETVSTEESFAERADTHAQTVAESLTQVAHSIDEHILDQLICDLHSYEQVSAYGMLKAQAAAIDLQVDLLMLGKQIETCTSYAEQLDRIMRATSNELVVLFSYTGDYFGARDLAGALSRIDRPRIWMVAGTRKPQPDYVYGCLAFASDHRQLTHPFQLEMVEALIAQEYARTQ